MPSLHETYATLLRCGMPKHPRLNYVDKDSLAWAFWTLNGCPMMDGANEADVRDLLMPHAMRWAAKQNFLQQGGIRYGLALAAAGAGESAEALYHLVRATAHLEPKQTPPATS